MDTIYLTLGEMYIVELISFSGAGYLWVPEADIQLTITKKFREFESDQDSIGGPAKQYFEIFSDIQGEFDLTLNHMRPWNEDIIDTKKYKFIIR